MDGPIDGRGPGVIACRRAGDSGLGSDALDDFPCGLGAREPGPTEALNFGNAGIGGVKLVEFWFAALSPAVGVRGKAREAGREGPSRLRTLVTGTKMPAPGMEVVKYDILVIPGQFL